MVYSAFQYLSSLAEPHGLLRTLTDLQLCRDADGRPICSVGNSALVVKVRHAGDIFALRCYTRPKRNLRAIYGERLLPEELFVYTDGERGEWCDVVLGEWVEGTTLQMAMVRSLGDSERMQCLASQFDRLALDLLGREWAHGDVKPENIIVGTDGRMHLIDFDAMYRPGFSAADCEESGTRAYQHPDRAGVFGKEIDDYPIALISTSLHALARQPAFSGKEDDTLPIVPARAVAGEDEALTQIEALFASAGDAVRYRVARLLRSPQPRLPRLAEFLRYGLQERKPTATPLCLAERGGLWGYRIGNSNSNGDTKGEENGEEFAIPPVYDCGFEFGEGLAAVQVGSRWHFIDTAGRVAVNCADCDSVKPFRGGVAEKIAGQHRTKIDKTGKAIG